jgi:arginine:agmatine antiporter
VIVAVLMTIVLFATTSPTIAGQFSRIVDLAVILAVIPYIYASVAVVKVVFDHRLPRRTFQTYKWIGLAAVAYCLWTVLGGDPPTIRGAMIALLVSVPLYPFFLRSMAAAAERKRADGQTRVSSTANDLASPHPITSVDGELLDA